MDIYRFEIPRAEKSCCAHDVLDLFNWLDIDAATIEETKGADHTGEFLKYVVMATRSRRSANLKTYIEETGHTELMFRGVMWLIK